MYTLRNLILNLVIFAVIITATFPATVPAVEKLNYTTAVENLADGMPFYSDIYWHSMKDSVKTRLNAIIDTLPRFIRYTSLNSGDSTLDSLRVRFLVSDSTATLDTVDATIYRADTIHTTAGGKFARITTDSVYSAGGIVGTIFNGDSLALGGGITATILRADTIHTTAGAKLARITTDSIYTAGGAVFDSGLVSNGDFRVISGGVLAGVTSSGVYVENGVFELTGNMTASGISQFYGEVNAYDTLRAHDALYLKTVYRLFSDNFHNSLNIASDWAGYSSIIDAYTVDSDNTDENKIRLWAEGKPNDSTDSEYLQIGTTTGNVSAIQTIKNGTGTAHDLLLQTGSNTNQLYLENDGDIGVKKSSPAYSLDVAGGVRADSMITGGITATILRADSAHFTDGVVIDSGLTVSTGGVRADSMTTDGTNHFKYVNGSFTGEYLGFSAAQTVTCQYSGIGRMVTLSCGNVYATSNATTFEFENDSIPAAIKPSSGVGGVGQIVMVGFGTDNTSVVNNITVRMYSNADWQFQLSGFTSGWTSSGNKGIGGGIVGSWTITYLRD